MYQLYSFLGRLKINGMQRKDPTNRNRNILLFQEYEKQFSLQEKPRNTYCKYYKNPLLFWQRVLLRIFIILINGRSFWISPFRSLMWQFLKIKLQIKFCNKIGQPVKRNEYARIYQTGVPKSIYKSICVRTSYGQNRKCKTVDQEEQQA